MAKVLSWVAAAASLFLVTLFPANGASLPVTLPPSDVTATSATLHATITLRRSARVAFQIRAQGTPRWVGHSPWQRIGAGSNAFSLMVQELLPATDYEVRAIALVNGIIRKGNTVTFSTLPSALTGTADQITRTSARLLGSIPELDAADPSTAAYFEFGPNTNYNQQLPALGLGAPNSESVAATVDDLTPNTLYYFRLVVSNANGVGYGDAAQFRTLGVPPPAVTGVADQITRSSARLTGSVPQLHPDEQLPISYFEVGTTMNYDRRVAGIYNSNTIVAIAEDLAPDTEYHFRLVLTNAAGVSYGSDAVFHTLPCVAPGTIAVVTNCTEADLLAAIANAREVQFAADGLITLTAPIDVVCPLKLDATGHNVLLGGSGSNRLFNVKQGGALELIQLTIAGGRAQGAIGDGFNNGEAARGGALCVENGSVSATDCRFEFNVAAGGWATGTNPVPTHGGEARGGAVWAKASFLGLTNCSFANNSVAGGLGGWYLDIGILRRRGSASAFSGAIHAEDSALVLVDCVMVTNSAPNTAGAIQAKGGTLEIRGSLFLGNRASLSGGALINDGAVVSVSTSEFFDNRAGAAGDAFGGGICQIAGEMHVSDSFFFFNAARGQNFRYGSSFSRVIDARHGQGGGLAVLGGTVSVERSAFSDNRADGGAASHFVGFPDYWADSGNGLGGAIFNQSTASVVNCSFWGNIALSGDIPAEGYPPRPDFTAGFGGAVANAGGSLQILSSTIATNGVFSGANHTNRSFGGGVFVSGGNVSLANTILAGNMADYTNRFNIGGTFTDLGHNVSSDNAGFTAAGSLNDTDPLLGDFGDYGGLTATFPLLEGSPCIDAGGLLQLPATDQRGVARPQRTAPDIGAFERE